MKKKRIPALEFKIAYCLHDYPPILACTFLCGKLRFMSETMSLY